MPGRGVRTPTPPALHGSTAWRPSPAHPHLVAPPSRSYAIGVGGERGEEGGRREKGRRKKKSWANDMFQSWFCDVAVGISWCYSRLICDNDAFRLLSINQHVANGILPCCGCDFMMLQQVVWNVASDNLWCCNECFGHESLFFYGTYFIFIYKITNIYISKQI